MKHVFVHIGTPKTGTSFIQRKLYYNASELLDNGFGYHTEQAPNNRRLVNKIKQAQSIDAKANEFIRFLDKAHTNNIILSDEALALAPSNWLRKVSTKDYTFHVACYVRSPASYAESAYKQWGFKQKAHTDFFDYTAKWEHPVWLKALKQWKNLGARICIYPYAPRKMDILAQFKQFLGVNLSFPGVIEKSDIWGSNPSFSALGMELARRLHERTQINNPQIQLFLQRFGIDEGFSQQKNAFIFMRPEQVQAFNLANRQRIEELETEFDVDLFQLLTENDLESPYELSNGKLNEDFLIDILFKIMNDKSLNK